MTKFVARFYMPSVWIEQRIIFFSYFRIQLIDFDLQLHKVINVVLNRCCVMAFCAKIFLHESPGSRWIIRSHKSQLVIYCFQSLANFPLALSFSHKTATKAFLVGARGPKGQVEFRQNTIWELSIFALWVREPPQIFIFPLLWTFTCSRTRCAINRVRGVAGILFRMASRQTAAIATSCSIWPHEILAFSTSAFPSLYSSHILAHFQVFTMQRHAIDCFVCEQHFRSVIFTSGYFVSLEVGEGQMLLFRYLWRVMHKSNLGRGRVMTFLAKNF